MALDEGLIHSESLMADTPQSFGGYDPKFPSEFFWTCQCFEALQRSLNVPAVDLFDRLGPCTVLARLSAAGLRFTLAERGKSEFECDTWGAGTSLEELVGAYRAFGHERYGRNAAYNA